MQDVIPDWPKHIFWDVQLNEYSLEKYPGFVIVRVFERGDIPDIKKLRRFYGDERIQEEIKKAKYIEPETLNFLSAIYNIPKSDFRCCTGIQ